MTTTVPPPPLFHRRLRSSSAALLALALSLCCAALPSGCATDTGGGTRQDRVAALADLVWAYGQAHPGGFTLDLRTMAEPSEGIAASHAATQDSHSREDLERVVAHALAHDGFAGGWFDPESGLYYFDSTRLFPEDRMEDALRFGRENGQHTLYILSTGAVVPIAPGETD